ncbi:recombination regulator RecX [bacterium]|jgi:regulatory protein|nr:recombination regulator RecX [bacterium]
MLPKQKISIVEAIIKARTFCNYRERCHKELRDKLYSFGLWKQDVDHVMMQMMDENLLNEERYAKSYARGHFYNKKWGKYKITVELRSKQIHDRLIKEALKEIEEEDYESMIIKLIERKAKELKGKSFEKKQKVNRYLLQKGYSYNEITSHVNSHFQAE